MKQLLKLLALNKGAARRFEVVKAEADNSVTVYLYDAIVATDEEAAWWGGVSAQSFVKEIRAIDADVIHLRINSPGGDVFAARAMEQALREHKAQVIVHVDGYAASAASYLALAGDEVEIAAGGFFMIHKAWTFAYGNADDLTSTAQLLDKIDESLVSTYAAETGADADQLREWMRAETWFNSDEAVQHGFADRVAAGAVKDGSTWNLSAYANAPTGKHGRAGNTITLTFSDANVRDIAARIRAELESVSVASSPMNTDELRRRLRLAETTA
jgi:ATP-dependent Clp protease, protease subunit